MISMAPDEKGFRLVFPVRLSIVTYNLWGTERWAERAPAIRRFCETYQPDVMGIQELSPESRSLLDDALPGHARVDDDFPGWTTEGNIWWNAGLFEPVDHGAEDIGIEASPDRRLFWVRLRVKDRPRTLWVGDLHLTAADTRKELDEGVNSRVAETKRAIGALGRLVGPDEAAFLVGDFNDSLAPLAHLFGSGYHSCFAKLGEMPPPTMPAFGDRLLGYGFASSFVYDWIVANDRARPLSASSPHVFADHVPPSDHWPVHAVYELAGT
jgi:endonuclease/exonuclease/phosphatase family metal-dependent hydrolase